jgi:hypothetical protein
MSELETTQSNQLVVRVTGEVVNLEDPVECVDALVSVKDLRGELGWAIRRLTDAIAAQVAKRGTSGKTLEIGDGRKAVLSGGKAYEYDGRLLQTDLLAAGMPPENVAEIVEKQVVYKVDAVKAKKAASVNADYRFAVEANRTEVETPVYVSIRTS